MKAEVMGVDQNKGQVVVNVRRASRFEILDGVHHDLHKGDKVEVRRQANNPYLVRVMPQEEIAD